MLPSDDHIFGMAQALHREGTPLTPITVFPVGDAYYVMDGHHRLAAYDTARWTKAIPAQVYQGSLDAAWRSALARNSKDKLPMTKEDKLSAAWRIVKKSDPRDSIASTANLSQISESTVSNMRSVWGRINDGKHGDPKELQALKWSMARMLVEGRADQPELEDWLDKEADKLVDALANAKLIGRLTKSADILARALEKSSVKNGFFRRAAILTGRRASPE
jgi:ParB-like nuclease domain